MRKLWTLGLLALVSQVFACMGEPGDLEEDPMESSDALLASGDGLTGQYFDKGDLTVPVLTRTDAKVDFDWGKGSPDARIGVDDFSARWTGFVTPEYSQTYTFYANADDGVRLWVDGKLVIDDWTRHSVQENKGTITLAAGKAYPIKLEYFDAISSASVRLSWSSPSRSREVVPKARLYTSAPPTTTDPHAALLSEVQGFASAVTGGKGAPTYWVTNLNDSGTGSLRDAATKTGPLWIRFKVSGTIALRSPIPVRSDKTIDGRGQDVLITKYGLNIDGPSRNVIVTSLKFDKATEDLIRVYKGASLVWIHHNDFGYSTDGAVDVTEQSTDVTISWNHFRTHDKTMLIGASPESSGDKVIRVTVHHNLFDGTTQRHPRLRFGKVHAFNNYVRRYENQGMYSGMEGQLLSEANIFEAGEGDMAIWTNNDPVPGYAKSVGDWFIGKQRVLLNKPERVFDPKGYYQNATVERANDALAQKLMTKAGWRK